ncbi:hypothetical protein C1645_838507 [Glomus cerebriforme]|uniref:F-box domain-containing protein n=1 Tax=Glomus cerebriforme TaxID=658196 RepID=A0A397S4Z5_9GLOM|nr:hypothetical protein C1645_838507 [Glomus cerebriforme]
MTASILLSECLEMVFLCLLDENHYTMSVKDLYPCTLVSRHWCRISTPFLYAYPFHHLVHSDSHITKFFKLIRTLLNCIPKSEIEQITSSNSSHLQKIFSRSNKKHSPSNISLTFNYITFIRGLIFNEIFTDPYKLFNYQKIWSPPYIPKNHMSKSRFSKISIPIMNHLFKTLCKNCNNLKRLAFTVQDNDFFNTTIDILTFKDHNGRSKLCDLKELHYISRYEIMMSSKDLYLTLLNDVCNLQLLCNEGINSIEKANSISQFISLQKKLEHVILSERCIRNNHNENYNIVLNSLSTQSKTLQKLNFTNLSFSKISDEVLESLCSLNNIKELKLRECKGLNDNLLPWAKSLTNLEVFELILDEYTTFSKDFLIQLIHSSSNTLIKLIINYGRSNNQDYQLFQQIPNSLIHLELPKIFPNELISIFKSCTRLTYFSTILSDDDCELWKENFKNLGKFIPKNLQKIQFKGMNNMMFNNDELKCFFEDCIINNDSKLKYLEISGKLDVCQTYYDVAKEFGVKLTKRRNYLTIENL